VASLAHGMDQIRVTALMGIFWASVGTIVERVVTERLEACRLEGLERIRVDELSYRQRHRYLTTVADPDRRRLAWASRSKLRPSVKAARTIRKHGDGIGRLPGQSRSPR